MKRVLSIRKDWGKDAKGAVLVEFALVLPLMALLFLTVIDLGLVIWEHQVLQNATREAARFSSLPRAWVNPRNPGALVEQIKQRVVDYCQEEGISVDPNDIVVAQDHLITVGGLTVKGSEVTVTYDRSFLIPGAPLLPFPEVTLTGRAVFRNLY